MKRFRILVAALTVIGVLGWAAPTQAAPITYTVESIASGTLGATPFTNALVTVELTADTSGAFEPDPVAAPGFFFNPGTATLTIDGLATATFNDPSGYSAIFFPPTVLPNCPCFSIFEGGTGILGLMDASLAGYDLQSAFGPLTGTGGGLATNPDGSPVAFLTTAGTLFLTDGGDPATLTVTVAPTAVPEPASLSLVAVGALGALRARRRRQRQEVLDLTDDLLGRAPPRQSKQTRRVRVKLLKVAGWVLAALLVLVLVAITATIGWRPFIGPSARALTDRTFTSTPERLARGRYLSENLLNCFACHSDRDWSREDVPVVAGTHGAGSTTFPLLDLPGKVYPPNITPDKETGAGNWTDDQLARAIREGIGNDGRALFPFMPYENFRYMSDEDLASVIVYLRSIPARPP